MNMFDTPATCENCGNGYMSDGYQWTCDECHHPKKDCPCGSDDISLGWEITTDGNGELIHNPVWRVECAICERRTVYFETAKEAYVAWMNGEIFTPIPGTGHFEEVW